MRMKNHGEVMSIVENWFVHQSSVAILPEESYSSKAGGICKGNDEFCLTKYIF
jgi:hypothetical protein